MKPDETQFGTMLHALQERAKELNCLYRVGELLSQSSRPLEEIFRGIIEVLPPGWQYPHDCEARIVFENLTIQPPNFQVTPFAPTFTPIQFSRHPRGGLSILASPALSLRFKLRFTRANMGGHARLGQH